MNGYSCVSGEAESLQIIERSKFICNVKGINSEEEARSFIAEIKKRHSFANHHCYAYIADEKGFIQKFSDDGEPQGTAGLPMLNVLKNRGIYRTVAVVTRYFGGIKLGAGGLTRAYGGAVNECLNGAKILNMQPAIFYTLEVDYDGYVKISNKKYAADFKIIETEFAETVKLKIVIKGNDARVKDNFLNIISDVFKGQVQSNKLSEDFYCF